MGHYQQNEVQIIKEIRNGQPHKYKLLVDRYSPMVFMIVRGFVVDEDKVEELAQQIFVKVFERLNLFRAESKFSTWLYSLTLNHCRDFAKNIRRLNKSFSEMEEHDLEPYMIQEKTPDQQIEAREWKELIKRGLQYITPEYAEAFLLKYRDDMTYQAMSKRLDVSVSALKVRVFRARNELKEFIENRR